MSNKDIAGVLASLKACGKQRDLQKASILHGLIVELGSLDANPFVASTLIAMYSKCGALPEAAHVLHALPVRDVVSWSSLISGYAQQGHDNDAFECFERMRSEGLSPDALTFTHILKACAHIGAADKGERIHDEIVSQGLLAKDIILGTALVDMYAKCGALSKAEQVLYELPNRDVVAWSVLIAGYSQQGQGEEVLKCYEQMQTDCLSPDIIIFVCILKACSSTGAIDKGKQVHNEIQRRGFLGKDTVLEATLVDMYVKWGAFGEAVEALDELPIRTVASFSALIMGYAQQGMGDEALNCFKQMQQEGLSPNALIFTCLLKACGCIGAIEKGVEIHNEILRQQLLDKDFLLGTSLVDMYAKCGALVKAKRVFEELPDRDVATWNALLTGYAQQEQSSEVIMCFEQMQHEHVSPNGITYACILKVCGNLKALHKGEHVHNEIIGQTLLRKDIVLGTALIDMYVKCGAFEKATIVLEGLPVRDVTSWCVLIGGYAQQGQAEKALNAFEQMQGEGLTPDSFTFNYILKACGCLRAIDKGKEIHNEILRLGVLGTDVAVGTSLVDMYVKCSELSKAAEVLHELPLHDVASWSALIAGYAQQGQAEEALTYFGKMQHEGLSPNAVTFTSILKACGSIGAVDTGLEIHDKIRAQGLLGEDTTLGATLVDMYVKFSALEKAAELVDELPVRNAATWSALISGCVQHEQGEEALNCYDRMQHEGLSPNAVTFVCILKACSVIGALHKGEQVHTELVRNGLLGKDIIFGNTLVDMYAKCGALAKAAQVIAELPVRNIVSWSALMAGYAQQGRGSEALKCFEQILCEGLSPDCITMAVLLSACSRAGLVKEGLTYYQHMNEKYGIKPHVEHISCMIDLFSRSGKFDDALALIEKIPPFDQLPVWHSFLGSVLESGNVLVGRLAFDKATQIDKNDASAYTLLMRVYAAAGMQECAKDIILRGEK